MNLDEMATKEILAHLQARLGNIVFIMEYAKKERKIYYQGQADCLEALIAKIREV